MTLPSCGKTEECKLVYGERRCCSGSYCELARKFALEKYGIVLQETGNKEVPFMAASGCVVEPHLRPVCSLHTCRPFTYYFILRGEILAQAKEQGKIPFDSSGEMES